MTIFGKSEKPKKPKKVGRPKSSTKSKHKSKKGGNFLGSVGELVAPSGWESFVTTAGLFALDRADASFRRGNRKAEKADKKSGNKMSKGGSADGSALSKTMIKKTIRKQVGGDITELSTLIYNNISPFVDDEPFKRIIKPEWAKYITKPSYNSSQPMARMSNSLEATQLLKDIINQRNSRGQTLLFLAGLNCNSKLIDLLRRFGANEKIINDDGSTILHGIAWGNDKRPGGPPTYEEKERMLQEIIPIIPKLVLNKNDKGETFYHNLMYKYPETVPDDTKIKICSR
jgi:hypothetical protein